MHTTVYLLPAGQPRRAGMAAKFGQFVGQFSCVKYDTPVLKGLTDLHIADIVKCVLLRTTFLITICQYILMYLHLYIVDMK